MECFDCAGLDRAAPAVGVCADCGAGVCRDHARVQARWLLRDMPIGRPEPAGPPARTVLCSVCQAAYDAVPDVAARAGLAHHRLT